MAVALNALPENNVHRVGHHGNFGGALISRFNRTGSVEDLDKAIKTLATGVKIPTENNRYRARCLQNYRNALRRSFEHEGTQKEDVIMAVAALEEAVKLNESDHTELPMCLNDFAGALIRRFDCTGDVNALNRAVSFRIHAVQLGLEDTNRAQFFGNLGIAL